MPRSVFLLATTTADTAGSPLQQQPCDGRAAQAFSIENIGRGYYRLTHAGNCLDVSGGSVTAGAAIQLWTCNDLSPQIWHLEPR